MILFEPVALGGLKLRNRIMMSPMSQRAAGEDGRAGDWHLVHYGSRAVGGCGLVMIEDTAVAALGRTGRSALGLYERGQVEPLRRIACFCHEQGAAVGLQIAHAGRRALADTHGAPGIVSASPIPYAPGWQPPRQAQADDLAGLVAAFAAAASLAVQAGIDVLEIHAAHGYLLHQFLSPLTNRRDDDYGVDPRGRRRLLLEVVGAVRDRWPAPRPLFVRLPAADGFAGGLQPAEVVDCASECVRCGADLIDLTGGTPVPGGRGPEPEQILATAHELVAAYSPDACGPAAGGARVLEATVPRALAAAPALALGGGVESALAAAELIERHGATLVSVGRPLLEDPYWPLHIARRDDADRAQASAPKGPRAAIGAA
ncbi:MAG TPA: hypothetical protein VMS02_02605 [Solirubrobacteraceae bacterium]|nr:hypothetical protein [Solirubrobacteraceae bacterium]